MMQVRAIAVSIIRDHNLNPNPGLNPNPNLNPNPDQIMNETNNM